MNVRLAVLFALLSSVAANAAPLPKVVFYGDGYTAVWPLPAGYINAGVAGFSLDGITSSQAAAAFESDVVSQHPAIVHIMVGANNQSDDATFEGNIPNYITDITTMVNEAKAANIKVILGTMIPMTATWGEPVVAMDGALEAYGAANGIRVINYYDALCGCQSSVGGSGIGIGFISTPSGAQPPLQPTALMALAPPNGIDSPGYLPTAAGYSLMIQMAQTAIANLTATLTSGWLQNLTLQTSDYVWPLQNQNTVGPGQVLQFTPIGVYSDGSQHPQVNSNYAGASGTWTTSNPEAMFVTQTGKATALVSGTAIIKYTSPNGVQFSEWIMYIQ
jgi:hypothetical protein